ncbi:MAG: hypothetical protein IPG39_16150 [Bacteroidetes bacterium]|nr:hypothetical protein [Bacteroidota bacterium]
MNVTFPVFVLKTTLLLLMVIFRKYIIAGVGYFAERLGQCGIEGSTALQVPQSSDHLTRPEITSIAQCQ